TARMKIVGQAVVASAIGILAVNWAHVSPEVIVPFVGTIDLGVWQSTFTVGGFALEMPWLYLGLVFFMVLSFSNTVNLTDGLDGLAAGTVMIVMLAFSAISFAQDNLELALFGAAVSGACLGFLWYNSYPADIFMGDTGSLGLGAVIATMAVVTKTELLAPLLGGIYVAEGLSVILQVASFKLTGKRIFRMAPLHHHFEMKGWSETKVMVRFWIVTGALAGAGFALWFVARARF
ncbi:MAG: phospho-N-acetylmuramoyl-pentapeptide-transferase, partial [Coriobacteriia bacterium]|nr:phospho-N-acetylmuramoyl-pentapeptide-transferase [Coriobacteriia bacterium]